MLGYLINLTGDVHMQSGIIKQKNNPVVIIALITAASLLGDSMLYIVLPVHCGKR
ncbi:hypothetical protein [Desulfotomaculum nigrificans]|uniref:hypothetical protein n=1 Tax=Desulfotomaculum nigrificans TaxID=1565 RepID=UPI0001FAE016|nr:hypothetical protein [Desulfotomaculum nigrificans]